MIGALVVTAVGVAMLTSGSVLRRAMTHLSRVELYRWVVQRRSGWTGAALLLTNGDLVRRRVRTVVIAAAVVTGLGLSRVLAHLDPIAAGVALVAVALPAVAVLGQGVAAALGRHWSTALVGAVIPRLVGRPLHARDASGATMRALLDSDELSAMAGVLDFTERQVREVMTPRTDIVAMPEGAPIDQVARTLDAHGFSRAPVYRESLDEIVGMIFAFDILKIAPGAELPVREVAMVPGSKPCIDVLAELQRDRRHMAVVLDEYGGTAGIITVEDLLETLVGEIYDESDASGADSDAVRVELLELAGSSPIETVRSYFGVAVPELGETVAGLLAQAAGRIPRTGDRFVIGELEFVVIAATQTKVERVVVRWAEAVGVEFLR